MNQDNTQNCSLYIYNITHEHSYMFRSASGHHQWVKPK